MKKEKAGRWKSDGPGRGRKGRQDYTATDGRMDPKDCEHTQFLDLNIPGVSSFSVGRCLDCGHAVWTASRELYSDLPNPLLGDTELLSQRAIHRAIWFKGLELPPDVSPGI